MIGSAAGLLSSGYADNLPLCAAGAAGVAVLAALMARLQCADAECTVALIAGSLLAGLSMGADAARRVYAPPLVAWFELHRAEAAAGPVPIEGLLREDASPGAFGVSLTIDVRRIGERGSRPARSERSLGGVRLSVAGTLVADEYTGWREGRTVRVTANLREPTGYLNPGAPDDRRSLARRGIVLVGSVKSAALVEVVAPGSPISEAAGVCRAWARSRLTAFVGNWSRRSGGIAAAILIGDRTGLAKDDERRLQEAGTYHVIAISGGNIAILTMLLLGSMRVARVPARPAAAGTIILLLFYGRLTVPAASIDRAVAAAVVYLAARVFDQHGPALNILAVAAAVALAAFPATAFDPGFILSFGATLGILVLVPRLIAWGSALPRLMSGGFALLAATVAAELVLAPVGAVLFARITFAGLLVNFAAIPLMTIVQSGSLFVLGASAIHHGLAGAGGYCVHLAATWLVESARLVDIAPWLSRDVAPPAWWLTAGYYLAGGVALSRTRFRWPATLVWAIAGLLLVAGPRSVAADRVPLAPSGWLRVAFLDVGQGDATVTLLPDGRVLLIDAGGLPTVAVQDPQESAAAAFDVGERVVAPALRALGVRRLDALVLTHGDPDHIGGAPSLLRRFRPRAIWEGVPVPPHAGLRALASAAGTARMEWRTVVAGDVLRAGGVEVRVLHPPLPDWERQRVRNDDSIVLELRYGDLSVILPGDIGREGESAVLRHVTRAPVVILKAPHHGSASSSTSEFLDALRPAAVVFSAGRNSMFGHPAPAVVARYHAMGSTTFSTADDGAVLLDTDGRIAEVRGWTGRRLTLCADQARCSSK